MLKEIDEVFDEVGIDKDAYQQHLYSQPIMKQIINLIPYKDKLNFSKLLRAKGCNSKLVVAQERAAKPNSEQLWLPTLLMLKTIVIITSNSINRNNNRNHVLRF